MKAAFGSMTDRVLLSLKESGPMTRAEIEDALDLEPFRLAGIVSRLALLPKDKKGAKRRIHICRWAANGAHDYACRWVPVYKLGHGTNKPRPPKMPKSEVNRRYWANRKARLTSASVFRLGAFSSELMRKDWKAAA